MITVTSHKIYKWGVLIAEVPKEYWLITGVSKDQKYIKMTRIGTNKEDNYSLPTVLNAYGCK